MKQPGVFSKYIPTSLLFSLESHEPQPTAITTAIDTNPNEANQSNRPAPLPLPSPTIRHPPAEKTAAVKSGVKKWESALPSGSGFLPGAAGCEQGGRERWAGVSGCAGEGSVSALPLLHLS